VTIKKSRKDASKELNNLSILFLILFIKMYHIKEMANASVVGNSL